MLNPTLLKGLMKSKITWSGDSHGAAVQGGTARPCTAHPAVLSFQDSVEKTEIIGSHWKQGNAASDHGFQIPALTT